MYANTAELSLINERRCSLDVTRDVLTVSLDGACATRIVYKANLTFSRFKKYSAHLVDKGLLSFDGNSGTNCVGIYKTTEKGKKLFAIIG